MNLPLRYSPSGAVLSNSSGGELKPGEGMQLRLAEGYTVIGGTLQITTTPQTLGSVLGGGTVLVETLLEPSADLRYRASLSVDVGNSHVSTPGDVVLFIDTSVDGSTWVQQVDNAHAVGPGDGSMHCRLDMTMRLGSELSGGIPAGSPSLRVRGRIALVAAVTGVEVDSRGQTGGYDDFVGTCLLQLSEHF
jgi:hypothetical protein